MINLPTTRLYVHKSVSDESIFSFNKNIKTQNLKYSSYRNTHFFPNTFRKVLGNHILPPVIFLNRACCICAGINSFTVSSTKLSTSFYFRFLDHQLLHVITSSDMTKGNWCPWKYRGTLLVINLHKNCIFRFCTVFKLGAIWHSWSSIDNNYDVFQFLIHVKGVPKLTQNLN